MIIASEQPQTTNNKQTRR